MAVEPRPRDFKVRKDNLRRSAKDREKEDNAVEGLDFHLIQCPACEKEVKVHKAFAGRQMGCSYCKAPLEIIELEPVEEESAEEVKKRHGKPLERRPLAFRILAREDIAEGSDLEFADEYERRRLPSELPAWDDEVDEADRHKKGKILTRKEQVFRTISIVIMTTSLAAVGVILYSAFFRGAAVVKQDHQILHDLPAEVQQKIQAVLAKEKPISAHLTSDEEVAALAVVNGFVNAATIEERLPFVRDQERVEPLLRKWYGGENAIVVWPDGNVLLRDKLVDNGRYFIRLAIDFGGMGTRVFAVEQTRDGFLLDWETAAGYQPMPYAEFVEKRPREPIAFRVKVKPSDYYNNGFSDPKKYRSVDLSYPGDPDFRLAGYIDVSQPWAPALLKELDRGGAPSMILRLKFNGDGGYDKRQVEIDSVVANSWWL